MEIGTLVKHLPERVSAKRAKWLGIVVGTSNTLVLVKWLTVNKLTYHPSPHLEVICE